MTATADDMTSRGGFDTAPVCQFTAALASVRAVTTAREPVCFAASRENHAMPYVNIKITREGATPAQKAELIKGVTELLQRVLNKNPATTFVVIDEVQLEDWGIGGLPVDEFRRRSQKK